MCWSKKWETGDEKYVVGKCPECGTEIDEEGRALRGCFYSPVECKTCGWQPCDQSC